MISKKLKNKQNKQLLSDLFDGILEKEQGSYLMVQDILQFEDYLLDEIKKSHKEDPRFEVFKLLEKEQMIACIKEILLENKAVKIYLKPPKNLGPNHFLLIDDNKYKILLAKHYGLISNKNIEQIFLEMPVKLAKKYSMKKINREAYNKHIRFAKNQ